MELLQKSNEALVFFDESSSPRKTKNKKLHNHLQARFKRIGCSPMINISSFKKNFQNLNYEIINNFSSFSPLTTPLGIDHLIVREPHDEIKHFINSTINNNQDSFLKNKRKNKRDINDEFSKYYNFPSPNYFQLQDDFLAIKKLRKDTESRPQNEDINSILKQPKNISNYSHSKSHHYSSSFSSSSSPSLIFSEDEIIFHLSFFHPLTPEKIQDIIVYGNQFLSVLRDNIYCYKEHEPDVSSTDPPNLISESILLKTMQRNAFFFIENRFYDDTRSIHHLKYSDDIIHWVNNKNRFLDNNLSFYDSCSLEKTKFNDLFLRLNTFYLYQHLGDCKHPFCFTDVHIINNDDSKNPSLYPLIHFQKIFPSPLCQGCNYQASIYICYGDKLAPTSPVYYCQNCFDQFHYDINDNLIYDNFQIYRVFH